MMKRILVAFTLALAICSPAFGQTTGDAQNSTTKAEREVRQVLDQWLDALRRGDIAALERIIADDYQITISDGRVLNRTQDLEPLRAGMKFVSATTEDVRIRIFKDTAIVTGKGIFKISFNGKEFDVSERFTDVYAKRKGSWQPVASHSTSLTKK